MKLRFPAFKCKVRAHSRAGVLPIIRRVARQMNLKRAVQLQAVVRADGSVKEVHVVGGHPLLAESAARALMQWRYEPASKETLEMVRISFGQ